MNAVYGNPSSTTLGGTGSQCLAWRRLGVRSLISINANPAEIVFTSSGTEANNLALVGWLERNGMEGSHVITSTIEHPAIMETARYLERRGVGVHRHQSPSSESILELHELAARRALQYPSRLHHDCKQHHWQHSADRGDGKVLPFTWHRLPHRCGAGSRQAPPGT